MFDLILLDVLHVQHNGVYAFIIIRITNQFFHTDHILFGAKSAQDIR